MSISLQCEFWAVGQGLFSSGKIVSGGNPTFSWVYDCGTSSDQNTLHTAISQMKNEYTEKIIDLLVISHFDDDHKNGIDKLLKDRIVRYLLLPYRPLPQRIFSLLFSGKKIQADTFKFYLDPVKYIISRYSSSLENTTILLVPEYMISDEPISTNLDPRSQDGLVFEYTKLPEEYADFQSDLITLRLLKSNTGLRWQDVDIVPYNEPFSSLNKTSKSEKDLNDNVNLILNSNKPIQDKINDLEKLYVSFFGSSNKNRISLFLYVCNLYAHNGFPNVQYYQHISPYTTQFSSTLSQNWNKSKNAILYTGDGYLETVQEFNMLEKALGKKRMKNIFCFQVMHHGSKSNWQPKLAPKLEPCVSVFCADENRNVLNADVVKDFLPYTPILVNKTNMLKISTL